LPDWEEELWGTDPDNPDSDGDGTPDGEEAASDRNPTSASANDTLPQGSAATVAASIDAYLADPSRTETEKLALELFRGYGELRQTGGIGTSAETDLIEQLAGSHVQIPTDRYISADLTVVSDSEEARVSYKTTLTDLINSLSTIPEHELITYERALQNESERELAKLDIATAAYTSMLRELLAMPVPRGAASTHLEIANNLAIVIDALHEMRVALSDPLHGVVGFQLFNSGIEGLTASFENMNAYLKQYGLSNETP
jgi:hypothetical protein